MPQERFDFFTQKQVRLIMYCCIIAVQVRVYSISLCLLFAIYLNFFFY